MWCRWACYITFALTAGIQIQLKYRQLASRIIQISRLDTNSGGGWWEIYISKPFWIGNANQGRDVNRKTARRRRQSIRKLFRAHLFTHQHVYTECNYESNTHSVPHHTHIHTHVILCSYIVGCSISVCQYLSFVQELEWAHSINLHNTQKYKPEKQKGFSSLERHYSS